MSKINLDANKQVFYDCIAKENELLKDEIKTLKSIIGFQGNIKAFELIKKHKKIEKYCNEKLKIMERKKIIGLKDEYLILCNIKEIINE